MDKDIKVIRSKRRTIGISVDREGKVTVRIPVLLPLKEAERFVEKKQAWIEKTRKKMEERAERIASLPEVTEDLEAWVKGGGGELLRKKTEARAREMGVTFGRISVKKMTTRWGSCSSKGNLSFNIKLFLMPERIVDYVIVHELAHRKHMNHSESFWKEVEKYIPDYRSISKELKDY